MPAHTPVETDELLDEILDGATLLDLLEGATLLDETLDGATLLDDTLEGATLLDVTTESHEPKSVHALLAAQPTPGS